MLTIFRSIAVLEGISYLMLFGLSMPLKYWAQIPEPNIYIGYAHGFLFISFVVLAILFYMERKLKIKELALFILAALLPFGTFYLDRNCLKNYSASQETLNS
jgi:integral membrane protein